MSWLYETPMAPSARVTRSRLQAPSVHVHDVDGVRYRGAQVWNVAGAAVTIRTLAEHSFIRDYVVAVSLFTGTDAAPNVGDACVVTVEGNTPDDYLVVAVRAGRATFHGDAKASVERDGLFSPALLNGCVPGCHLYQDEY